MAAPGPQLELDLDAGARAVLAVSGGADSAGLALLVRRARPDLDLTVVHVRHGLRDDAADAAAAAAVAAALELPYREVAAAVDPASGEGPEGTARAARYTALRAAADGAAVLVGHTADDQAETVLLALGRGTGIRGLAGMRPVHTRDDGLVVVRPLLRLRRAEVRAAVAAAGLPTVEDPTNDDEQQRRGRVRREVLPALARLSGGPGDPVGLLVRLAALARDDSDLLDDLADAEAARLIRSWGPVRLLRSGELAALPVALRRRVVRTLLAGVRGGRTAGLDAASVERVLALSGRGASHVSGGVAVRCAAGWLTAAPVGTDDLAERRLSVPGAVALPELGLLLRAAPPAAAGERDGAGVLPPRATVPRGAAAASWAVVDAPGDALLVRARRPGDRSPGGRRRLADRMAALGLPRALRGLVPVICDVDGGPRWVPGIAVAPAPPAGGVALHLETLER